MEMPPLVTERLLIRPFAEGDLPSVLEVLQVMGGEARAVTARYVWHGTLNAVVLAELGQPPYGDRAVVLRAIDRLVGICGLVPAYGPFGQLRPTDEEPGRLPPRSLNRPEVGLYYAVHPDHRGRGYATEAARALVGFAFGELRVERIVATTERDNVASQAVMRHLEMRMHENALDEPDWFHVVGVLQNPALTRELSEMGMER
jgi:[ribosomal protein S5]-alanine N-acetyltransferase